MIIKTALKVNSRMQGSILTHILNKNSGPECIKNFYKSRNKIKCRKLNKLNKRPKALTSNSDLDDYLT